MTADAGAARFIPVTSEQATEQAVRERLDRENGERRFRRLRGLPEPAPVAAIEPKPKARPKLVVKTAPAPQPILGSSPIGAGAPKPGRETATRSGSAPAVPPGSAASDEVRMSRREFEAVARLIDKQPWSKSGKRGSVGRNKS